MQTNVLGQNCVQSAGLPESGRPSGLALRQQGRRRYLILALDLLLVVLVSGVVCFWHLGHGSFGEGDETQHVLVTQRMMTSGNYWSPKISRHIRYYGKPPLKMWLSTIPVRLLGESNFSYRVLDALAGVGTFVLVFLCGRLLFSRIVGFLAVLSLLGCQAYIFNHGPRMAVQDSALVFLFTLAMYAAWHVFGFISRDPSSYRLRASAVGQSQALRWAVFGGIALGCAALIKSVAGYVPLLVVVIYGLLSRDVKNVFTRGKLALLLTVGFAFVIPAPYFAYHCLFSDGACATLFAQHSFHQATSSFSEKLLHWFYLQRIFVERAIVNPELLALGLCFALFAAIRSRDKRYLFILCWAVIPVAFYTIARSRYTWYIAPAYPGMCLIIAAMLGAVLHFGRGCSTSVRSEDDRVRLSAAATVILFCVGTVLLASRVLAVSKELSAEGTRKKIPLHEVVEDIQDLQKKNRNLQVLFYQTPEFSRRESPYRSMLASFTTRVADEETFKQLLSEDKSSIVFTRVDKLPRIAALRTITAYRYLPSAWGRTQWIVVLSFLQDVKLPAFIPAEEIIHAGEEDFPALYGWTSPHPYEERHLRWMNGAKAALLVPGSWAHRRLGADITLRMAAHTLSSGKRYTVEVRVNSSLVAALRPTGSHLKFFELFVPPDHWQAGENVLEFVLQPDDGLPIGNGERSILLDWIRVELGNGA